MILEVLTVNNTRIGNLGTVLRSVDGFVINWEYRNLGIIVTDPKMNVTWMVPWANIACIREVAETATKKPRKKRVPAEPNDLPIPHSGPTDKRSLAPFLGQ